MNLRLGTTEAIHRKASTSEVTRLAIRLVLEGFIEITIVENRRMGVSHPQI